MFTKNIFLIPLLVTAVQGAGMFDFLNKESATQQPETADSSGVTHIPAEATQQTESLEGIYIIKSLSKPNLCIDDMASRGPAQGGFHLWECNEYNINQHFTYIEETQQLYNPHKNLCVDDGGTFHAGDGAQLTYWPCDANNINQRFEYNLDENMFYNPNKNLCLDDGGAFYPGESQFHLWECNGNVNQKFELERLEM